jgi:hypothetical protein
MPAAADGDPERRWVDGALEVSDLPLPEERLTVLEAAADAAAPQHALLRDASAGSAWEPSTIFDPRWD